MRFAETEKRIVCCQGIRWHVRATDAETLEQWLSHRWPDILSAPPHIVKQDAGRTVCIGSGFVVKETVRRRGLSGWIAGLLPSKARRAFQQGSALFDAGVPVAKPLAWACVRRLGFLDREYLICAFVPDSVLLMQILSDPNVGTARKNAILKDLGSLPARFHRAGYTNRDMKDGNLLVRGAGAKSSLCVVDLDGVRRARLITRRRMRRDFYPILQSLILYNWDSRDARRIMIDAYNDHAQRKIREDLLRPLESVRRCSVEGWICHERVIRLSGFTKKTLRIYIRDDQPQWTSVAHRYWQGRLRGLTSVASSPQTDVHAWSAPSSHDRHYFKRFFMRSRWDRVKHCLRASRAMRAFLGAGLAERRGFNTARNTCVIEAREFGCVLGSAILTEAIEGATPLNVLLAGTGRERALERDEVRTIAEQLGEEVGRWHTAGLVHGDMRHGNILCRNDGARFCFFFLDNERTRANAGRHERVRNLVQLNMLSPTLLSLRNRVRFWHAYCRTAPGNRRYKQAIRMEAVAWTQQRWHKRGWC